MKNKKLYPAEGIERKQKGKQLKPIEMPYYAKRKDTKKFLKGQYNKQIQAKEEQAQTLAKISAKRQRQLFGERQPAPTDPTLLATLGAKQAIVPGQEDIQKDTFLRKLLTPQEFTKYQEGKIAKKAKQQELEAIPGRQLEALGKIASRQPQIADL